MAEESSDEPPAPDTSDGSDGATDGTDGEDAPAAASDGADEASATDSAPDTAGYDPEEDDYEEGFGQNLSEEDIEELEAAWDPTGGQGWPHAVGDHRSDEGADADATDDLPDESDADDPADADEEFDDVELEPPEYESPVDPEAEQPDSHSEPESPGEAKSDGGYADGTGTAGSEFETPGADEEFVHDGPASDQEMPLADHIEEMVRRLGVVLVVMAIVSGIVFPFGAEIINFLWYSILNSGPVVGDVPQPRVYAPLALILARLKVATLAGFVVGLPVFVYETYLFMRPGLYPKERRYYLASVPTSLVLATVGVLFAYFLVLPFLFTYFLGYTENAAEIAFGLTETFDLMVLMLGWFALIFQIPLFVALALMMGIVSRRWMADRRLYFWGAFVGIAFLFAPDPTGMAPILVAATMIALFEGTLFLDKWTKRGREALFGR
ncbi:twin-arginine translocase subunit TatC [Salinirubellus salinus]|uniref:twin-arginine translocase subunit TatC n=1 Tax=Salinirubellus salinus TaxID=1364945 RepID=UPI0034A35622